MKGLLFFVIGIGLIFSINGCSPEYGMANGSGAPIYFAKPFYKDSAVRAIYVGGKFEHSLDSAYSNSHEKNYFGEFYIYRSHSWLHCNLSYGLFGYTGSYKVAAIQQYRGDKPYYGGGISTELDFKITEKNFEWRFLGFRGTLIYEDGSFYDFRRRAFDENLISDVSPGRYAYNFSVSSEYIYKFRQNCLGLYTSYGWTRNFRYNDVFPTIVGCLNYSYRKITVYSQLNWCILAAGGSYSLGIAYRF